MQAFVYYPDKTVVDSTGIRLTRGAVLLRPDWLITSSLEDGQTSLAFPKETLVARLGAIRIDSKFTLFEDEDEQEREVIYCLFNRQYNKFVMLISFRKHFSITDNSNCTSAKLQCNGMVVR